MKRNLFLTAVAVFMLFQAMTVFAAPKQMPDGGTFDPDYYAATYADVRAVCGNNENLLYTHYKVCGAKEGRHPYAVGATTVASPSSNTTTDDFDAAYYASKYPDLAAVFGTDATKLYQHWITCGKKEGRIAKAPVKQESKSSSGSSDLDNELSDNASLTKQLSYLINVYRLQKNRKELKLNDQLNVAATRLAIGNEAKDKSSSHMGDKDYKKLAKESSYNYDEIECVHFEKDSSDAQKIFDKLMDEDKDALKEKVYKDLGIGKCDEFYVFIFACED